MINKARQIFIPAHRSTILKELPGCTVKIQTFDNEKLLHRVGKVKMLINSNEYLNIVESIKEWEALANSA